MSDLHFEMHADGGAGLIRELDPTGVDVLVLAGDITMARHYVNLESVFKPLAKKYRHFLYVPGNHEYHKSSPTEVARNLAKLTKALPEIVIPENDAVVIAGQRFIVGTMWFRADPTAEPSKRFMHDFSLIQDFEPWVYEQNAAFEKVLATHVAADDVVVTHHLPAIESVPARFARSAIRTSPRSIEVVQEKVPLFPIGPTGIVRTTPFTAGDVVEIPGMRATVLRIDEAGRPMAVRYEFDRDLDGSDVAWIAEGRSGFVDVVPPSVGIGVRLAP